MLMQIKKRHISILFLLLFTFVCKQKVDVQSNAEEQMNVQLKQAVIDFETIVPILKNAQKSSEIIEPLNTFLESHEKRNKIINDLQDQYPEMVNNIITKNPKQTKKLRILSDQFTQNLSKCHNKYMADPNFISIYQKVEQIVYKNE